MNVLESDLATAKRQLYEIERQQYDELEAARRKIEASFSESISEANKRVEAAKYLLNAHRAATATHPLLGKKVTRACRVYEGQFSRQYTDTQIFGLCEVFTSTTPVRRGGEWRYNPGDIIVRVLKKDGKPGLTIERVEGWREFIETENGVKYHENT